MNIHFAWIRNVALILATISCVAATHAAGTIRFANSTLTRMQWYQAGGTTVPVPAHAQIVYGVFWGTNRDELTLALPLGTSSTSEAGLIVASSNYSIPGTEGGQTVFMQIKGWSAQYGTDWGSAQASFASFGQTDIRQVTLAPASGPGVAIWSTTASPNKFAPLLLGFPLTPPAIIEVFPDITVDEGNQGEVDAVFTVRRNSHVPPFTPDTLNFTSTVWLTTADMTARAGQDYVPTNVLVTFGPGETAREVRIKLTGDALSEPDEQFSVNLGASTGAVISSHVFVVTIREAKVLSVRQQATNAVVTIQTTSSQRYALESSLDMTAWSVVPGAQNIAGTGGAVQVTDSSQACCSPRFYRTRILP